MSEEVQDFQAERRKERRRRRSPQERLTLTRFRAVLLPWCIPSKEFMYLFHFVREGGAPHHGFTCVARMVRADEFPASRAVGEFHRAIGGEYGLFAALEVLYGEPPSWPDWLLQLVDTCFNLIFGNLYRRFAMPFSRFPFKLAPLVLPDSVVPRAVKERIVE